MQITALPLSAMVALAVPIAALAQVALEKQFAETPEARIAYVEAGDPEGTPVLFVHGLPFSSYIWRDVIAAMPQDLRLIAPDLAGFGDSEAGEGLYGVDDQARHLAAFADALGLEGVIVVGHDWGAGIGLMYAAANAQEVAAFAFFEGSMPPVYPRGAYADMPERVAGMFQALRGDEVNVLERNMWLDTIMPTMTAEPLPEEVRAEYDRPFPDAASRLPLLEMSRTLPIAGEPAEVDAAYSAAVDWWTSTEIPKLVLYAEPGRLYPEALVRWNEENAVNVTTASVGEGLHALQEEAPEAVAIALSDWLATLE